MNRAGKKVLKPVIAVICIMAIFSVYICWETPVAVPKFRKTLDQTMDQNYIYLSEDNYSKEMKESVVPYLEQYMTDGYIENDGLRLYYRTYITGNSERAIAISHGFTDYADKFQETIYYFLLMGFDVYILEHRGHGNSGREIKDPSLVYVQDFNDYVEDYKVFLDEIVLEMNEDQPLYLFAHSMGGGIGTAFLERYPGYFDAAILSTPMVDVKTGSVPEKAANIIASIMSSLGLGKKYVTGQTTYCADYDYASSSAKSESRYAYYHEIEAGNERYQLSASSYEWLNEALDATHEIIKADQLAKIKIPVLLFQAEEDFYIDDAGIYKLANRLSNVEFIYCPGTRHVLFMAENDTMIPYFNTIFEFLDQQQ